MPRIISDVAPRARATQTHARIADSGITYNEAGLTYNATGYYYGLYDYDVAPFLARLEDLAPVNNAILDLPATLTKIATVVDAFNQTTLNPRWYEFTAGGAAVSYAATGAQVTYPASSTSMTDGDITTYDTYDLTSSGAYLQVLTVPSAATSADAEFRLQTDTSNWFRWLYEGGTLFAQRMKNGTKVTIFSVAYNASTHKWWRIAESGGVVTWYTSTDGINWTSRGTFTHGMAITTIKILLAGTCFQNETNPGAFKWNNLNS